MMIQRKVGEKGQMMTEREKQSMEISLVLA